jgi:hypothetical protein
MQLLHMMSNIYFFSYNGDEFVIIILLVSF